MNVVIFTQGVSPIVQPILELHTVTAIVESGPRGATKKKGTTALELFCQERQIPYFWLVKDTHPMLADFLMQSRLEIGVVYSMSQLLPEAIIQLFPRGIINAHPSLLPSYRGPNPYFRMFYDGASETGITIHYLDKGEDTGDILLQEKIPIEKHYDFNLQKVVLSKLPQLLLTALERIENKSFQRKVQPKASPTARAVNVTTENVQELLFSLSLSLSDAAFFYSQTLSMLPLKQFGILRLARDWKVKTFIKRTHCKYTIKMANKIFITRYGCALKHREGWIVLKLRAGKLKYMLKLVRDCFKYVVKKIKD